MYFNNAGWFLTKLYPTLVWRKKPEGKTLYLTFDDGPIPDVTEYVLEELKMHSIKATFFCVGDNIYKHPAVFAKIISEGHRVANHTFNHMNGWKTEDALYFSNIEKCNNIMCEELKRAGVEQYVTSSGKKLFRPPYGLIKKSQIRKLNDEYEIIMWDVLTGDFSKDLTPENCLRKSIRYTQNGSIVIFHDSIKAEKNLRYALPRYLDHYLSKGYRFELL